MRCGEVMRTDAVCLRDEATVSEAARLMRDHDVAYVAVCDSERRVVGTLSEHDIVVRVCAEDFAPATRVRDVMSSEVVAVRPDDGVEVAGELMSTYKKTRVLVVDEQDVLRGTISPAEVLPLTSRATPS